ncbi:MAG: sulfurtransferase [Candidatus Rokubacteria bacterium]|nr:sulfurtransferase [Candidatus Rokubacteria bacterium]
MRTMCRALFVLIAIAIAPGPSTAADLPAIVTTEWLEKNVQTGLTIVDIRKVEEYREGHIPGAINVFYGTWAMKRGGLDNELPAAEDLADVLDAAGIRPESRVVVAGKVDTVPDRANNTRVAWTLAYAGVGAVGILDGGYAKWQAEKRAVSTERPRPAPATVAWKPRTEIFADKAHVLARRGQALVVDTRMPDFFFGVAKLDFVDRAGRVAGAVSLPTPWIFEKDGRFKSVDDLRAMAVSVVGNDPGREIITYCDTGRLATGWWWVLTRVLGYQNVRMYDGSSQDYARDSSAPMARYGWQ